MSYYRQRKVEKGDFKLTEKISLGALARVIPAKEVDKALETYGKKEKRSRLLPSRVVVYYIIIMTIHSHAGYREVIRIMVEGLKDLFKNIEGWSAPGKTALINARRRVGAEPLKELYHSIVKPIATKETKGAWYRNWRLTSLDGATLDIADTPENEAVFGRPGNGRGTNKSAYPQVRLVMLCEQGTHVLADVEFGNLAATAVEGKEKPDARTCGDIRRRVVHGMDISRN